jgi:hypothetical protein
MVHKKVLITDYIDPFLLTGLKSMDYTLTYAPEMSRAEMEDPPSGLYRCSYQHSLRHQQGNYG